MNLQKIEAYVLSHNHFFSLLDSRACHLSTTLYIGTGSFSFPPLPPRLRPLLLPSSGHQCTRDPPPSTSRSPHSRPVCPRAPLSRPGARPPRCSCPWARIRLRAPGHPSPVLVRPLPLARARADCCRAAPAAAVALLTALLLLLMFAAWPLLVAALALLFPAADAALCCRHTTALPVAC